MLLPQLRFYYDLRKQLTSRIDAVLTEISSDEQIVEHRDVNLLRSLPGVGRCVAATMPAEASQALAERDYHAIRSYAGGAPIIRISGKMQSVLMRYNWWGIFTRMGTGGQHRKAVTTRPALIEGVAQRTEHARGISTAERRR